MDLITTEAVLGSKGAKLGTVITTEPAVPGADPQIAIAIFGDVFDFIAGRPSTTE
jgi:hypothetical protein